MATTVARMQAVLSANTRDFDQALGRSQTKAQRFGTVAKGAMIGGAAAGLYGLAKAAKIGWDEFNQGQIVAAQTNAAIKSTGGVANVTAKEVAALGEAIMRKTGIDDEAIRVGENQLLTFKNIRNEVGKNNDIFNQATVAVTDMATRMNGGLTPSSEQLNTTAIRLGKALNDPIKGLTAMTRVGVQFTDQQAEQIKTLVENGETMKAQKIILGELSSEFGGSATEAGKTFAGQINIMRERFNNFMGDLVEKAIPTLQNLATEIMPKVNQALRVAGRIIATLRKRWQELQVILDEHRESVEQLTKVFHFLVRVLGVVIRVNLLFWSTLIKVDLAVLKVALTISDKLIGAVRKLIDWFGKVKDRAVDLWGKVRDVVSPVVDQFKDMVGWIRDAVGWVRKLIGWIDKIPSLPKLPGPGGVLGDGIIGAGGGPRDISSTLWDDLALANQDGLILTSGYRPGAVTSTGNTSLHSVYPSKAIDVAGSPGAMRTFFLQEVMRGATTGLREVIHSPYWWHPGAGITRIPSSAGSVLADHYSHVHVGSYDRGGYLSPGWNLAYNGLGRPEPVGGGTTYNFNGAILDGQKLLRFIQEEQQRYGKRNGG